MQMLENYNEFKDAFGEEENNYLSQRELDVNTEYLNRLLKSRVHYEISKMNEGDFKKNLKELKHAKLEASKLSIVSIVFGTVAGEQLLQSGILLSQGYKGLGLFTLAGAGLTLLTSLVAAAADEKEKKKRPPEVVEAAKEYKGMKKFLKSVIKENKTLKREAEKEYRFLKVICDERGIGLEQMQ